MNLEIWVVRGRIKHTLILTKYDLESLFSIRPQTNTITAHTVYEWCCIIIDRISYQRRFIYRIPYLLPRQMSLPRFDLDSCLRWTIDFSKNRFD
jgi:hypothetical protein